MKIDFYDYYNFLPVPNVVPNVAIFFTFYLEFFGLYGMINPYFNLNVEIIHESVKSANIATFPGFYQEQRHRGIVKI